MPIDPPPSFWSGRTIAITGGTGSLGTALTKSLLRENVKAIRLIARNEHRHAEMARLIGDPRVKHLVGDVRDRDRLLLAFDGADVVINAAALKRVEVGERDPLEFVRTNVTGSENVIHAARERHVERVLQVSTDKACLPITLYGTTKLLAERLMVAANVYSPGRTLYAACRYGNVAGSRGSLIPLLMEQRVSGRVTITDPLATRFWMLMSQAVELVKDSVEQMAGGEVFIPRLPSVRITDVIKAIAPGCVVSTIGMRGIEKRHEALVGPDESRSVEIRPDHFIIRPGTIFDPLTEFTFTSDTNPDFLSVEDIFVQSQMAMGEAA